MLGLHIRGTDAPLLDGRRADSAAVALPFAQRWLEETDAQGGLIFLATDSAEIFQDATVGWPASVRERVVTREGVGRGQGTASIFGSAAKKGVYEEGLDALIDMQLLAKCDWLVHSRSIFTESALYWSGKGLRQRSRLLEESVPAHFDIGD